MLKLSLLLAFFTFLASPFDVFGQSLEADRCKQWPPPCSQRCTPASSSDGVRCSCDRGYQLVNQSRCATGDGAFLLYAELNAIVRKSLDRNPMRVVVHRGNSIIHVVAMDVMSQRVFWFDSDTRMVMSIAANDTRGSPRTVISNGLSVVSSMAYDWVDGNLYIADVGLQQILACSTQSGYCTAVVNTVAHAITVDANSKKLFWSECEKSHVIKSSSLNGENMKVVAWENVRCATSLVVDHPLDTLYWADPELHRLESVRTDGTQRRNVTSQYIINPVEVAILEDDVYWLYDIEDKKSSVIERMNKFTFATRSRQEIVKSDGHALSGIHIYHPAFQMPDESNACQSARCSDICLQDGHGSFTCACPPGKTLDADQRNCINSWQVPSLLVANGNRLLLVTPARVASQAYETLLSVGDYSVTCLAYDNSSKSVYVGQTSSTRGGGAGWKTVGGGLNSIISRVPLSDPTQATVIVANVGFVAAMTIDWISRHLYWADSIQMVVEMSNMDGSLRTILVNNGHIRSPKSMTVAPLRGHLYISECGAFNRLHVCDLDGHTCYNKSLEVPTGCVSSLSFDVREQTLYWADSRLAVVSSIDLARRIAKRIRHSPEPQSIAVSYDNIYWTDALSGDLYYHARGDEDHGERLRINVKPLGAIVAIDGYLQPDGKNGCSDNNGGCSHSCVALSRMQSYCKCPESLQLAGDGRTCLAQPERDSAVQAIQPPVRRPGLESPRSPSIMSPSNSAYVLLYPTAGTRPTADPRNTCPPKFCSHNGRCVLTDVGYFCQCVDGTSGRRCEHGSPGGDSESYEAKSSAVEGRSGVSAGQAVAIGFVTTAAVLSISVLVIYIYHNHRRLRDGQVYSFKSLLRKRFGQDEHRSRLVSVAANDIIDPHCQPAKPEVDAIVRKK